MLNLPETYYEAGQKAAIARNQHDEGRWRHWRAWWAQARALESEAGRRVADEEYDRGWKDHRHIVRPEPF